METVVVFDGTSCYLLPKEDYTSDLELIGTYSDIDEAQAKVDKMNETLSERW